MAQAEEMSREVMGKESYHIGPALWAFTLSETGAIEVLGAKECHDRTFFLK